MKARYYVCFRELRGPNRMPNWTKWRKVKRPSAFAEQRDAEAHAQKITNWRNMGRTQVAVFHRGDMLMSIGREPTATETTPKIETEMVAVPYGEQQ